MTTTNEIFMKMLDWIYANKLADNQTEVARKANLNEVTISRILNGRVKNAKQETLRAVNAAYGNVFNLEWLRGKSDVMLVEDVGKGEPEVGTGMQGLAPVYAPDYQAMHDINTMLAAKDEAIEALKGKVEAKEETISELRGRLNDKERMIGLLERQLDELRREKGLSSGFTTLGTADQEHARQRL